MVPNLPAELLEAATAGEVVPVVGDWLNVGRPDGPATPDQLAVKLSQRISGTTNEQIPRPRDLPALISEYKALCGNHALIEKLREELGEPSPKVLPELVKCAGLASEAILTTNISHSLETAIVEAGHTGFTLIDEPINASYASARNRPWLIKLAGDASRPESLVVTQDELMWLSTSMDQLSILVRSVLLTRTLVFFGYHLDDPHLEMIHTLLQTSPQHSRRRFIVIHPENIPNEAAVLVWSQRGYQIIEDDDGATIDELSACVHPHGQSLQKPLQPSRHQNLSPFKFLDYFTEEDAEIFFGRGDDSETLASITLTSSFTLITGPSGVGKTSLINAGLVPRLHARGFDTFTVRALDHPAVEILSAIKPQETRHPATADLHTELRSLLHNRPTVVIIDQFEEFFLRIGPESRSDFARQLHDCLSSDLLDLRVVVVIREDFLHHLLELEPPIEQIFKNRYWVRPFTRPQATEFLSETAKRFVVDLDKDLIDRMLIDLDDNGVDPAHLQIVAHTLYRRSSEAARGLRLESYEELGGTAGILTSYLEHVLDDISSDYRNAARDILKCMVSAGQTKMAVSAHEIARDAIANRLGVPDKVILAVLHDLTKRRVVRPVPGRGAMFELAHDVLARKIWEWIEPEEVELKYVQQILQQSVVDWKQLAVLPGRTQWTLIEHHRESLSLSTAEAGLLLRYSLDQDRDVPWWVDRAEQSGLDVWAEFGQILADGGPEAKLAVLEWLRTSDDPRRASLLQKCFTSEYEAIRRAATRIIADRQPFSSLTVSQAEEADFVIIPGGEFEFGTEDLRFEHSQPVCRVYVSSFAIQRYPVTNHEYWAFVQDSHARPPDHWPCGVPPTRLLEHPVTQVSWTEAAEYCAWYSRNRGLPVRLPTAAEWEKAATWDASSRLKRLWSWGNEYDPTKGNARIGGPGRTTPIGQYSLAGGDSPYGIADMCGNTFDWVQDWWAPQHDTADVTDPKGPPAGEHKCARGGSWAGSAEGASGVCNKYSLSPETRNEYVGFRMAYSTED